MSEADWVRLEDDDELLLRQVHPDFYLGEGRLSKVAFMPSDLDGGLLSTRRNKVGADAAYADWAKSYRSSGTWPIQVGFAASIDLPAYDDSSEPGQPKGHASVDFRHHTDGKRKQLARKLRDDAESRGPLYRPEM